MLALFVSEIFYSIQGEGELTGVPSVFVRTSGCNLRCGWCDTPYASWEPEGETREIASVVEEVLQHPAGHVVLTGGEPMVARGIRELAAALHEAGKHVTIETAATVRPDEIACDLASLSPKLTNSTPDASRASAAWIRRHEALRLQTDVIRQWIAGYPYQLKFVVQGEDDLAEIDALLAALGGDIPPHRVLLMPEGTSPAQMGERAGRIVDICKERGFRYCARLHIDLFGNRRGT
ncbi:MAG TPA: radical SAM protein [Verrucomicrobiales bacterium]|nr:radical SAM protein [Verrucomicrobiales bacterium]